ncbi:hypothetical protein ACLMJK_009696 [Lecanora helva]
MPPPPHPPNIWTQMSYPTPGGACTLKPNLLTTCPCHRFMLHPLKAATSYDCDGCGHHACFHEMGNPLDEIDLRKREKLRRDGIIGEGGNGGVVGEGRRIGYCDGEGERGGDGAVLGGLLGEEEEEDEVVEVREPKRVRVGGTKETRSGEERGLFGKSGPASLATMDRMLDEWEREYQAREPQEKESQARNGRASRKRKGRGG